MTEVNKNIDNGKNKMGYAFFQIPSGETWTQVLFAGMR